MMRKVDRTKMFDMAKLAFGNAYAPYSKFAVGAVLCDSHGNLYAGCNVENAAYPQGICAEANAIGTMIEAGGRKIDTVLVMANGDGPIFPCGGCRQKLLEFCSADAVVLIANPSEITNEVKFAELMPFAFGSDNLG